MSRKIAFPWLNFWGGWVRSAIWVGAGGSAADVLNRRTEFDSVSNLTLTVRTALACFSIDDRRPEVGL